MLTHIQGVSYKDWTLLTIRCTKCLIETYLRQTELLRKVLTLVLRVCK